MTTKNDEKQKFEKELTSAVPLSRVEETRKRLEKELADVDRELAELNDALSSQAGDIRGNPKEAERLAARIVALDARRKTIEAAAKRNDTEAARIESLLKSKGYAAGKKELVELEKFFQTEADEVHAELLLLRERLQSALDKRGEYRSLLKYYGLDLSEAERMGKEGSKDIGYLAETNMLLSQQAWREERLKGLQAMAAEIVESNKRPPQVKPASGFRLNFWESHYFDGDGKPILQKQND